MYIIRFYNNSNSNSDSDSDSIQDKKIKRN